MALLPLFASYYLLLAASSSEVKIINNVNNSGSVSVSTRGSGNTSVKIENDRFEIEGSVTSVNADSFSVDGQEIMINMVSKDSIKTGNRIIVSGMVKNSILYAEKINLEDAKDTGQETGFGTPPPQNSPTAGPSPTLSPQPDKQAENLGNGNPILQIIFRFIKFIFSLY